MHTRKHFQIKHQSVRTAKRFSIFSFAKSFCGKLKKKARRIPDRQREAKSHYSSQEQQAEIYWSLLLIFPGGVTDVYCCKLRQLRPMGDLLSKLHHSHAAQEKRSMSQNALCRLGGRPSEHCACWQDDYDVSLSEALCNS